MVMQAYNTLASRNLIRAEKGMLKYADNVIVLGKTGTQKEQPQNATDTVVFRRLQPFNASQLANPAVGYSGTPSITANNFIIAEGVTPNANTVSYVDVSVTLQNFGVLYKFTSKTQLMYEDDIPGDMQKLVGSTLGEVLELVRYGQYKAGTSVLYTSTTQARASVNVVISLGKLRAAARGLQANRARKITEILAPGKDYATMAVEAGYVVYMHSDCSSDVRNLPGFTPTSQYGTRKVICPEEIGACEEFRFVVSPLFTPFADAGGAVAGLGLKSTTGTNADVYPVIVTAEEAWGSVALKGMGAIRPTLLPATDMNHANPMGLFGYVGANTWFNAVRLNENWMCRIETAVTAL